MSLSLKVIFLEFVFTLQSIKSRIETQIVLKKGYRKVNVFTLQSIKSRIETEAGVVLVTAPGLCFYSTVH